MFKKKVIGILTFVKETAWFFLSSLIIGLRHLQLVKIPSAVKKVIKIIIRKFKHTRKGLMLKMYPGPWLKIAPAHQRPGIQNNRPLYRTAI